MGDIKDIFFFPVAYYFAFWANKRLKKWSPRVIVVTGSSGKTTLFSLIEAQLGDRAHYSHHANSAIGVPFDILNLHRKSLKMWEWPGLFIKAPKLAYKKPYSEKLYIVECDADRPGEGKFLSNLLKPEVTLWASTGRTHSMNFDKLVPGTHKNVEEAIAHEFGNFLEHTSKLAVIDGDSELMKKQESRTQAEIERVTMNDLVSYEITKEGTEYKTKQGVYKFKALLPQEIFYSLEMTKILCNYLSIPFNSKFPGLQLPPARSSMFRGVKNITIIDSTYNANFSSMKAVINMFKKYPTKTKWAVLGDMLEQGREEKEEHEKLADLILEQDYKQILFLGPKVSEYTYPIVYKKLGDKIPMSAYEDPKDILTHLQQTIHGGETILFKGARFLEGVIENLLLDKRERTLLARREKVWDERRKKKGL